MFIALAPDLAHNVAAGNHCKIFTSTYVLTKSDFRESPDVVLPVRNNAFPNSDLHDPTPPRKAGHFSSSPRSINSLNLFVFGLEY